MSDDRNGGRRINVRAQAERLWAVLRFSPIPPSPSSLPQSRSPFFAPPAHSCSPFTTSSLGLAPPKIAELGLATWLRGVSTVRGLSWSLGRWALSSGSKRKERGGLVGCVTKAKELPGR